MDSQRMARSRCGLLMMSSTHGVPSPVGMVVGIALSGRAADSR
jgi:hypothetical protein